MTSKTIDREQLCPQSSTDDCTVQLDVSVTPVNYFRVIQVRVHVADVNDNAPLFPVDNVTVSVYELMASGSRFPLPLATDADASPNDVRRYSLRPIDIEATPQLPFRLDQSPLVGDLYLVLTGQLDRELTSQYLLTLTAVDGGSPPHSATLTVNVMVLDANDHAPAFTRSVYDVQIREDAPLGTTVVRVSASDADVGENGRVQYRRMDGADGRRRDSAPFDVDRDTGDVILAAALDRERAAEHVVGVVAANSFSDDRPPMSGYGYTRVVVRIVDVNDHPPSLSFHSLRSGPGERQRFAVPENAPVGSLVAYLSVTDRDAPPTSHIDCQLTGDGAVFFQLITLTGVNEYKLVSSRMFDREQRSSYTVTILCMASEILYLK